MSILDIDPWLIEPVWMFFDPSIYCEHRDPALASLTSWRPARRPLAAMVGQLQGDPGRKDASFTARRRSMQQSHRAPLKPEACPA
jgi:hypothetical protein